MRLGLAELLPGVPLAAWLLARRLTARRAIVLAASLIGGGMLLRGWLWQAQVAPHLADDAGAAMLNFIGLIYNPTYARLDGLLMGVSLAACRAFRPAWWDALQGHGRALLATGAIALAASTQIALMSAAGAILLFPLVALGCTMLLAGAISPVTWIGRRPLPGVRTVAILAFSLYLIHKQIYAWLDTLLVIGAVGAATPAQGSFALGAVLASLTWFVVLVVGARTVGRWVTHRNAGRALDSFVALTMTGMAAYVASGLL